MKKKKSDDRQSVADLLKKLQESYLGTSSKATAKKKQVEEDAEDEKFRRQLAAMLGRAETPAKKQKKSKKKSTSPIEEENEEIQESIPTSSQIEDKKQTSSPTSTETEEEIPENVPTLDQNEAEIFESSSTSNQNQAQIEEDSPTLMQSEEKSEEASATFTSTEEKPKKKKSAKKKNETTAEIKSEETQKEEPLPSSPPPISQIEEPEEASPSESKEKVASISDALEEMQPTPDEESEKEAPLAQDTSESDDSDTEADLEAEPVKTGDSMIFLSLRKSKEPVAQKAEPEEAPIKEAEKAPAAPADTVSLPLEEEAASAKQPAVQSTEKQTDRVIRISPPVREQKSEEKTSTKQPDKKQEPIRIQPKVTLPPPSRAFDFSKATANSGEPQPIVIRPSTPKSQSSEAIVIRPRKPDKPTPEPQTRQDPISSEPIKIGKENKSETKSDSQSLYSEPTHDMMKTEKETTATVDQDSSESSPAAEKKSKTAPQKASASQKKNAASTRKPGVSLPKRNQSTDFARSKKGLRHRTINSIPVTTLPDDDLEEVLDEALEDIEPEEISFEPPIEPTSDQRRSGKRSGEARAVPSKSGQPLYPSSLSEDDIAMIFELGYENELERMVGHEALKQMKREHMKHSEHANHRNYRTAFGYRGEELVSAQQKDTVRAAYLRDRKSLFARLCLTLLLTVVALFADMPSLLGAYLTDLTATLPFALPLVGMLTLWAVAALSRKQLNAGIRSFFKFSPTPYSVPALLVPIATVYDVALFFIDAEMLKANCLVCFAFLILAVCDVFRLTSEMRVLQLLSEDGLKTVLAPSAPRKKKLRQGDKIVKIINDDLGKNMYHVKKAVQTTGFFRRFNSMESAARPFNVMLGCTFALSTLSALVNALLTSSFPSALSTFMTVLLLSAPLSACLMYFYPIARANRLLAKRSCALLGEESVEEYREPKTVIFRDSELYTAEQCTEIAVREGDDFKNDLRLAGILFRKLGGTLKRIGESARTTLNDPPVVIVRIHDNGVEAIVDNRYHMVAGSAEFLKRVGVRVPRESTDKILRRTANTSVMYVAIDGVLKLSYEIEYTTNASFEELICDLSDAGIAVAIHSYDPNLDETFLQKSRSDLAVPIHAVKPGRFEEDKPMESVDTGAVALGESNDIVYPIYAARGIDGLRRFGTRIQLISALLATAASVVLSILGRHQLLSLLPILGYQLLWIAVSVVASFSELNPEKLRFLKKE